MIHPREIAHRFAFHPAATAEKRDEHTSIRQRCRQLADHLNEALPDGREKSTVMTKLEEVMFWANAAVARHRDDHDNPGLSQAVPAQPTAPAPEQSATPEQEK